MRIYIFLLFALVLGGCSGSPEPPAESKSNSVSAQPVPAAPVPAPPQAAGSDHRKVMVVFGDSLSAGYGLDPGQSFPDYLQKRLDAERYPWRVVNLGISGDTTEGGVARIETATSLKPALVVLELGGNDGLRGLPLKATRANLEQMITAFQSAGARVVLAGMTLPPNYGPDYIQGFEKVYRDLAKEHKLTLIPFLLSDIVTKDLRYLQRDGMHPTAAGTEIVSGTVLGVVKPLLGAPGR